MNCTSCNIKSCRGLEECKVQKFDKDQIKDKYHQPINQEIVQSAAQLVDGGRAGELSRLDEIIEFIQLMKYKTVGIAYCYGMEIEAAILISKLRVINGVKVVGVSCTTGALAQKEINDKSCINSVSCNPLAQAEQINAEKCDFVITMGLCLGHDVLFNRNISVDTSNFVVKDRVHQHNPILSLKNN